MADALCGPTSALASLQKHAQVDRSLQQDRLAARPPPQQRENFRSSPGPSSGLADAEFDAFQNGHTQPLAVAPSPVVQHHPQAGAVLFQNAPQAYQNATQNAALPAWAADFQQLNIHEARGSPIPAARFRHEAPLHRSSGGSWHAEFARQELGRMGTPPMEAGQGQAQPLGYTPQMPLMGGGFMNGMGGMGGFAGGLHAQNQPLALAQQQQNTSQQQVDMFDDAAFAAAFDRAAAMTAGPASDTVTDEPINKGKGKEREREVDTATTAETQQEQFSLDHACVEPPEPFFDHMLEEEALSTMHFHAADGLQQQNVGNLGALGLEEQQQQQDSTMQQEALTDHLQTGNGLDLAHEQLHQPLEGDQEQLVQDEDENERERVDPQAEADELSRTAGLLLDNLRHESSDKFANSSFMALMRQLRDREVRVEGDGFVEVSAGIFSSSPSHCPSSTTISSLPSSFPSHHYPSYETDDRSASDPRPKPGPTANHMPVSSSAAARAENAVPARTAASSGQPDFGGRGEFSAADWL